MKILITGASGFVGQALVKKLVEEGLDNLVILTRDKEKYQRTLSIP